MLQKFNPKNKEIKVWIDGKLYHRDEAKVSVFDSVVQGGDAVWEGLRIYEEGIFCFDKHVQRLIDSAKALAFTDIPDKDYIFSAVNETLKANGMKKDTHIRLTLTRGEKITSGMDPRLNQKGSTLIVLAEWKPPVYDNLQGIKVITSAIRRNNPQFLDSKIHHNNLLNNILAKIQANIAGADAALMLDEHGFASELNDTNVFLVKNGKLFTPHADNCLPGITRSLVMEIAAELNIRCTERNLSLTEFYTADEVFATGTMGELTPVTEIDGRIITNSSTVRLLDKLTKNFRDKAKDLCRPLNF